MIKEQHGELANLTRVITEAGGNFVAFGQFTGESPSNRLVTFKVNGLMKDQVQGLVEPLVERIVDIRD
jgi:uncharacterized protein with ACT and thioredoxin-like domain